MFAAAQRDNDIARERGMTLEEVFTHGHFPTSPLFDGDFTSATPAMRKLLAELETYCVNDVDVGIGDLSHDPVKIVTLLDFMSEVIMLWKFQWRCKQGPVGRVGCTLIIRSPPCNFGCVNERGREGSSSWQRRIVIALCPG